VFCGLAVGCIATAPAQVFEPQGGETPVTGELPGDQVFPALCLCPGGGYAVWQDSKIDLRGQGIAAIKLDGALRPTGAPFVINQRRAGHQEHPGAASLTGGGAAFVWQGGDHSSPNILARFARADGGFLTGDIQVNPPLRTVKSNHVVQVYGYKNNKLRNLRFRLPESARIYRDRNQGATVAALPDGGAIVTYAGWRRLHTNWSEIVTVVKSSHGRYYTNDLPQKFGASQDWMLDVFFQRFSADGKKAGGEVLVNQFAKYNQRNPSVAVLPDGTFVVVWVSENFVPIPIEVAHAQIDIMARLFSPTGEPLGGESIVNSAPRPSAMPVVSAMSDGRFTVVWAGRDGVRTNGWDIYGRLFSPSGAPESDAFKVNTHTYGDQFAPRISSVGANQFVVWTSLGQDKAGEQILTQYTREGGFQAWGLGQGGSWQSIYGRQLSDGVPVSPETRIHSIPPIGKRQHPVVSGDGEGRFLVAWSAISDGANFEISSQVISTAQPQGTNAVAGLSPAGGQNPNPAGGSNGALAGSGATAATTPGSISAGPRVTLSGPLDKLRLSWSVEAGARYQVQSSTNLVNWSNAGEPRVAGAATDSMGVPRSGSAAFYRVVKLP